jgi:hypothetical protein
MDKITAYIGAALYKKRIKLEIHENRTDKRCQKRLF